MTNFDKKTACINFFNELVEALEDRYELVGEENKNNSIYLVPKGTAEQVTYYGKPVLSFRLSDHWSWYTDTERCKNEKYVQCRNADVPAARRRYNDKCTKPWMAWQVAIYGGDGRYHCIFGEIFNRNTYDWTWFTTTVKYIVNHISEYGELEPDNWQKQHDEWLKGIDIPVEPEPEEIVEESKEEWVTAVEAAAIIGVCTAHISTLRRKGKISGKQTTINNHYAFVYNKKEMEEYAESRPKKIEEYIEPETAEEPEEPIDIPVVEEVITEVPEVGVITIKDIFNFVEGLTPSQLMYLNNLITIDTFYLHEKAKFRKEVDIS